MARPSRPPFVSGSPLLIGALLLATSMTVTLLPAAARAAEHPWLIPPVDAPVARGFHLPKGQHGPGNRGLDYAVSEGTSVRASGDGAVTFAGHVAGTLALTIDHGGGMETTYTGLRKLFVVRGDEIDQSHWLGETGARFHFGVKLDGIYVDPQDYLGPLDIGDAIHLIPLRAEHSWTRTVERLLERDFDGLDTIGCTERNLVAEPRYDGPPNDNVAVVVGGINRAYHEGSKRDVAGMAADLGYSRDNSYVLSYSDDPDSYERSDTFGDLRATARRLDALLRRIAREKPGAGVDILAHSQGGLIARYYLETTAAGWDPKRPRVEHLVALSAPHQGAPLAQVSDDIAGSWSGKLVQDGLSRAHRGQRPLALPEWLKRGHPVAGMAEWAALIAGLMARDYLPDPYARSLDQMTPGSRFLQNLATDDVVYGTRVLALQDKLDLVVPSDHGRWPGEANRSVDGDPARLLGGLNRHRGILENPEALGMTHGFLRGARLPCLEERDQEAWDWGKRITTGTKLLPVAWQLGEDAVLSVVLKGKATTVKAVVREGSTLWRLLRARGLKGVASYGRDKVTYVIRNPKEVLEWLADQRIEAELQRAVDEMLKIVVEAEP
ncbi:MAG: peptidoglycan DD-metalloendopeptidase family protein [Actinomycetota bacterium]